jgi:hypothetical protein
MLVPGIVSVLLQSNGYSCVGQADAVEHLTTKLLLLSIVVCGERHTHAHSHTHIHTCTHIDAHSHTHAHTQTHMHTHTSTHTYMHTHTHTTLMCFQAAAGL